jgi:hypothetical protein
LKKEISTQRRKGAEAQKSKEGIGPALSSFLCAFLRLCVFAPLR